MRCEVAREALSARLDSERENVPSIRVDEHLAVCAACAAYATAVCSLDVVTRDAVDRGPAPDLADLVLGSARAQPRPAPVPRRVLWPRSRILWSASAAAAALTGGLAIAAALHPVGWVTPVLLASAFLLTCGLTFAAGRYPRTRRRLSAEHRSTAGEAPSGETLSEAQGRDAVIMSILRESGSDQGVMEPMATITVPVDGLHCNGCVDTITKSISAIPGVRSVQVDLNTRSVSQVTIDTTEDLADDVIDRAVSAHGNFTVAR